MLPNDTTTAQYMGQGVGLVHDNLTSSLAGHMLTRPAQGVGGGLHPLEDEPTTNAEKAAFKLSQGVTDGSQAAAAASYSFSDTAHQVRSALRPGA